MIDLDLPVHEITANINRWVGAGDQEEIEHVARFAQSGFKCWVASQLPRKDRLNELLRTTMTSLIETQGSLPNHTQIIQHLWNHDDQDEFKSVLQEIDGRDRVIYWVDARGREQSTSFDAFSRRIQRMRKKHKLSP